MSVSQEFEEYIVERLECFGPVFTRRMFGGLGIYHNNFFFALAADNVLYFKVDDTNKDDYEKAGMEPFRPYENKSNHMNYYEVPPDVLEDDSQLIEWSKKAYIVALNAQKSKSKNKKK